MLLIQVCLWFETDNFFMKMMPSLLFSSSLLLSRAECVRGGGGCVEK